MNDSLSYLLLISLLTIWVGAGYCTTRWEGSASLVDIVRQALTDGRPCSIIIDEYKRQLSLTESLVRPYTTADIQAKILDMNHKKITIGDLYCVPVLIRNENQLDSPDTVPELFDHFKRRGAVAVGNYDGPMSAVSRLPYPAVILMVGLTSDESQLMDIVQTFGASKCQVSHFLLYRFNPYRKIVGLVSRRLDDLKSVVNDTLLTNGHSTNLVIKAYMPDNNSTQRLQHFGANLKNVDLDFAEAASITTQLKNLSLECRRPDHGLSPSDRRQCFEVLKRRFRLYSRFVQRVAEPLLYSGDVVVAPGISYESKLFDYQHFMTLLIRSHYPILQMSRCSITTSDSLAFMSRPENLSALLMAASSYDHSVNISSVVVKPVQPIKITEDDFCGKMILGDILDGIYAYDLCGPNGLCLNTARGIQCECAPGYGGRFCQEVTAPFTLVQKCVLYPTYLTVINNLTVSCADHTMCVPYSSQCHTNYCDNPHGWCLPIDQQFRRSRKN